MEKDLAPELLENIQSEFKTLFNQNSKIASLYAKVRDGTATYSQAYDFAEEVGETLAKSFRKHITEASLPNGKMYFNIAKRILEPTLGENHRLITELTSQIQKSINQNAGIGIRPMIPDLNQDRVDGLVNAVSSTETFEEVLPLLDEPVKTFSMSVVDDTMKSNGEFHAKAGLKPRIVRISTGKCCEWCQNLAGTYAYPDNVPKEVYQRHKRCRCKNELVPRKK